MEQDSNHRHIPMLTWRDWIGFFSYLTRGDTFFCQTCKKAIYSKFYTKKYAYGVDFLQVIIYLKLNSIFFSWAFVDGAFLGKTIPPWFYYSIGVVAFLFIYILFIGILPSLVFKYCYKFEEVPEEQEDKE